MLFTKIVRHPLSKDLSLFVHRLFLTSKRADTDLQTPNPLVQCNAHSIDDECTSRQAYDAM